MSQPLYFDNHATTPVDPRVAEAAAPFFGAEFGNAGSASHSYGQRAARAVERARHQTAAAVGATAAEVLFTSGATESINLAIQGACLAHRGERRQLITCATEHKAVLDTCAAMKRLGFETVVLPVDNDGILDLDALREALKRPTLMVAVMAVNNEIGVVQDVGVICEMAKSAGAWTFVDGAQAPGRVQLEFQRWGVDLCSLTAHKCYGPKGVGALIANERVALTPLMFGGGQERGLRPGTTPVASVVALGAALELAETERDADTRRIRQLRDQILNALTSQLPNVTMNGHVERRVVGNLNLRFDCVSAATLMTSLPGLALSSGSACSSGTPKPSHVLTALGLNREQALSSVRIGLGRFNTEAQATTLTTQVIKAVNDLRASSPLWALQNAGTELSWG